MIPGMRATLPIPPRRGLPVPAAPGTGRQRALLGSKNDEKVRVAGGSGPVDRGGKGMLTVSPRHSLRRRAAAGVAVALTAAVLAAGLAAVGAYRKLEGNVDHDDVDAGLGSSRPADSPATNILVVGSDTRAGQGSGYGKQVAGARADTLLVLHLAPARDRAVAVSLPRDSWVRIPSCRRPDGSWSAPVTTKLNASLAIGGPACTWKTIEALTGVHLDHFVQVDFAGFKDMVDALGGIPVCLPQPVDDPDSHLDLPAGASTVDGEQALAFVRARHTLGDGSDLDRIERQQDFMAAMVRKATSNDLLSDPARLYRFLDAATQALRTDEGFGIDDLARLAHDLDGLHPHQVRFVTVPVHDRGDGANVIWTQPQARKLFDAISNDHPPADPQTPTTTPTPGDKRRPAKARSLPSDLNDTTARQAPCPE
ncbi:MAG: LytR family transcriptional regulator [Streptosporangiales bacterium]|nr:LytR family transcriptional regulator [Streptosporangiales bacterium]